MCRAVEHRGHLREFAASSFVFAAVIFVTVLAAVTGCAVGDEGAEVFGQRGLLPPPEPTMSATPVPTAPTAPEVEILSGPAAVVEPASLVDETIAPILAGSAYRPGWLVWVGWNGTIVGLNLDPDADEAFSFDTGMTNIAHVEITAAGVIVVDADQPGSEIFVDWAGTAHIAQNWVVDTEGAIVAIETNANVEGGPEDKADGETMRNLTTGETKAITPGMGPPTPFSAAGPYVEWQGQTYQWTWREGLVTVGPGGVATWSMVPSPVVVLREPCDADKEPCALAGFLPGDREAEPSRVEAPNSAVDGYVLAPDGHAAAARGEQGWAIVLADNEIVPLADTSEPWWLSVGTALWGPNADLLGIFGEELALFDGRTGTGLGRVAIGSPVADIAFVDIDAADIAPPPPTPALRSDEDSVQYGENPLTPEPEIAAISFLEQEPDEIAESFRSVGIDTGWVVANLGREFLAIDVSSGRSRRADRSGPTAAFVATPFGVLTIDEGRRLILVGWTDTDATDSEPITLSESPLIDDPDPSPDEAPAIERLSVHRDPAGVEMVVVAGASQTIAVVLEPEFAAKTLANDPTLGNWPFLTDIGSGPPVMPFAARTKEYSWERGWVPTGYDRVVLSGTRYFIGDSCSIPMDCERHLVDRADPALRLPIAGVEPVAFSPDESTVLLRTADDSSAAVLNTATGEMSAPMEIPDEVITLLSDDVVLTLGESYELFSLDERQPLLRTRSGSIVGYLDEIAPLDEFDGEFFPRRGG